MMRLVSESCEKLMEPGGLESPSLFSDVGDGPPAFEMKFLLDEPQALALQGHASRSLKLDRYADPARGNSYPITSLYTDTPEFDVYRRRPAVAGCKYRVRRYGDGGPMFVEQKIKNGDRVRKRRSPLDAKFLAAAIGGEPPHGWAGHWFRHGVAERKLRPVCRIAYDRVAYLGVAEGHTVRITLDRNIRGAATDAWEVHPVGNQPVLLHGQVICEFKFRIAMPAIFKEMVADLGLTPSAVSKYRRYMQTVHGNEVEADA